MNRNNALIIFAKAPRLGQVKTRLQPDLTPEESISLYKAMVEDLMKQLEHTGFCDLKIFFYPSDAKTEMQNWLGEHYKYFSQKGEDLGDKMYSAMVEIFKQNYKKVVLIGSDIPTIDTTTIVRAFSSLDDYDIVLGPSQDGGYYLIGSKKPQSELFKDIIWSTSFVLQKTIEKARKAELEVVQLEIKSDIDTYDEVIKLWKYLKMRNEKGVYSYKSKTYEVLNKLFAREYQAEVQQIPE